MARSEEALAEFADQLFAPELADAVKAEMRKDAARRGVTDHILVSSDVQPKSIATGYLGDALYDRLGAGEFSGRPIVEWNGFDFAYDRPTFVFRQNPTSPFRHTTAKGRVIEPRLMDTDGGTIPLALHGVAKFSPWGYGPAYIIHDWLFVAHKCGLAPDNDISFEETADILAEAIKTLTVSGYETVDGARRYFPKAEDTLYLIYKAVSSYIARGMWDDLANIVCRR